MKPAMALLLALVSGCVDIIGYINFGHLFSAHLTGNTVHFGQQLLEARWTLAARAGGIIAAFLAGSLAGRTVIEIGFRRRIQRIATATLLLEACLIAGAILCSSSRTIAVLMLASAMGMQTATLTRVGALTVHTTFVTGMLNKLAQLLSHAAFLTYDLAHGRASKKSARRVVLEQAQFIFSVWFFYLAGAVIGTLSSSLWGLPSLLLPISLVLLLVAGDQYSPLSIEEEQEVSER
jgi:uncharacterized membrane protein YoaK (UPF0700 family)